MIYGNANIIYVARTVGNSKEICLRIYAHASTDGILRTVLQRVVIVCYKQ